MAGRLNPPHYSIRSADSYSNSLAKGLDLAYLMLEGRGSVLKNYGSWGAAANLQVIDATWRRSESGLYSLGFSGSTALASNISISRTVPEQWSYAAWVKLDQTPTTGNDIFSLRGLGQDNLRIWADSVGVWSWQKRLNADTYTVMPPGDAPVGGARLLVSVFRGIDYPPVPLRSGLHLQTAPQQPNSHPLIGMGAGPQVRTVDGIYLGNNSGLSSYWNGTIGPFYFWDRTISEREIWQLWQDPYAPFRRSQSQVIVPSILSLQTNNSMQSPGKEGDGIVLQNDSAIYIFSSDDYTYRTAPDDHIIVEAEAPLELTIHDNFAYTAPPEDEIVAPGAQTPPTIGIIETLVYRDVPDDAVSGELIDFVAPTVITIADSYLYQEVPTDAIGFAESQAPIGLGFTESVVYRQLPEEDIPVTTG